MKKPSFRQSAFYKRHILPVYIDLLKFFLWLLEPALPEAMIDEVEELLAEYYGTENDRLPNKVERIARKLNPGCQEQLLEYARSLLATQPAE